MRHRRLALAAFALVAAWPGAGMGNDPLVLLETTLSDPAVAAATDPAISPHADGGFVVVWEIDGSSPAIAGRRLDSGGAVQGPVLAISSPAAGPGGRADAAATADGGFAVVWSNNGALFSRRFDANGAAAGTELVYAVGTGPDYPAIAARSDSGTVVAWQSVSDGSATGIEAQLFDSAGAPLGTAFAVNTYTTEYQVGPDVAVLADDGFVVVWGSRFQDAGTFFSPFGRRFDSSGAPVGTEFRINTYTTDAQANPAVAATPDGGFVVVWGDLFVGVRHGIAGQRFSSTGAPAGTEFQVSSEAGYPHLNPSIAVAPSGELSVAWHLIQDEGAGGGNLRYRRFSSTAVPLGDAVQVNSYAPDDAAAPVVAHPLPGGDAVVSWYSRANDFSTTAVQTARVCVDDGPDSDGDAIGDLCDACTNPGDRTIAIRPDLRFRFIQPGSSTANHRFAFSGELLLPAGLAFADIDPTSVPIRIRTEGAAARVIFDATLTTDTRTAGADTGWRAAGNGSKWLYKDKVERPPAGLLKVQLRDRSSRAPGQVRIRIRGKAWPYGILLEESLARVIVSLSDATLGECAETAFEEEDCSANGAGVAYRCRR